ncbi:TIR domain-containing protein [Oscillatoria sp. CS-180]|uniref:toll/interleukin-1 receptor domain-containing protein n=1 Tax=Oscillatoria sp. CS-180 TaxID=3021720 RepID=UPI0023315B25|nr:TIR domain-containing protein [Oscillatoria sp. CS-180]MDB9529215.1 TIR domain-containing protein [Oscillatoria sp. CS-180]
MGEDALDSLLKGKSGRRRSRLPGLKMADILTMPPQQQSLVNWLMRNYEALPQTIADKTNQDIGQIQENLKKLIDQGLLKTVERNGSTYYRVKLAPKSGRQMPTDVWQVLDGNTKQANVFISYSRRNKEFVQELHIALEATGREVWVDWENIPVAVDWWQEIQLGIELADTFVFVLSPDSVASKVCGQEIEEALKHNKRLVPVVCQDVQPDQVHPELARLNWIFLRPQDDFQKGFQSLLEALDQDLDYVRTHTRLLVRALEWDRSDRDSSYLLRGADLDRANQYLAQGKDQEPRPTALHHQYVLASAEAEAAIRDAELERQKTTLAGQQRWLQLVTAVSIIAVVMGIVSWGQSRRAQQAQRLAEQAQLRALNQSAQALFLSDQRFDSLIVATQAGELFQSLDPDLQTPELKARVLSVLQQALFWVQERNRLEGHTGTVWQVAFSPDEQKLASVSADGNIRLWGLDGSEIAILECNGNPLLDLDFSPDGEQIVAVDSDGSLHSWSSDGTFQNQWSAHQQPTRAVAFSPDGNFIATASEDATVKVWSLDGQLVATLDGAVGGFQALLWTEQGQLIAGDERGDIYVWEGSGQLLTTFTEQSSAITALDIDPEGKTLAAVSVDRQVRLYDLSNQTLIRTFEAHYGPIYNVSFTPDGQQLITVGDDKVIRMWQLDGTSSGSLVGHTGLVAALAVSPDGDMIATSGGDRAVRLWDLHRDNLHVLLGHQGPVNTVAISPNSRLIASGGVDSTIRLWNKEEAVLQPISGHTDSVNAIAFSAQGDLLASASSDGTTRIWRQFNTTTPTSTVLEGHEGRVNGVEFHPDGDLLASVGEDHTLRLWETDGTLLHTFSAHRDGAFGIDFSPDGQYLVTTGWDHLVRIWPVAEIETAEPVTLMGHRGWVLDAQFSPDSQQLVTASYDNTVHLWRVSDGEHLETFEGHGDGVLSVTFSPDGEYIISTSNDNSIRIWNLKGDLLATLSGHRQGVRDIAIDPQGRYVASASSDARVIIWEREGMDDIDSLLESSCAWLSNYLLQNHFPDGDEKAICQAEDLEG